jgi:hypothetical protein
MHEREDRGSAAFETESASGTLAAAKPPRRMNSRRSMAPSGVNTAPASCGEIDYKTYAIANRTFGTVSTFRKALALSLLTKVANQPKIYPA